MSVSTETHTEVPTEVHTEVPTEVHTEVPTEVHTEAHTESGAIKLEGFLLRLTMPTEEKLFITIDASNLPRDQYLNIKERYEDMMFRVNQEWIEEKNKWRLRGWSLKARYKKTQSGRERIWRIPIFPTTTISGLKNLRARVDAYRRQQCLLLQESGEAFGTNIYLLPYTSLPSFIEGLHQYETDIQEIQEEIDRFKESQHFQTIKNFLSENRLDGAHIDFLGTLRSISVTYIPLEISPRVLLETHLGGRFDNLAPEQREMVKRELEMGAKDMVQKALTGLQLELIETANSLRASKLDVTREELTRLRNIAENVGLSALSDSIIIPMEEIVDNMERGDVGNAEMLAMAHFNTNLRTDSLAPAIEGRVKSFVDNL